MDLNRFKVVLGSTSARRLEILETCLKLKVTVEEPDFEENLSKSLSPEEYVKQTSLGKLKSILKTKRDQPTIVICCDTIIDCNGNILEKPQTKSKQREMFNMYRQNPDIKVISCVNVAKIDQDQVSQLSESVTTILRFDSTIVDKIVELYIESEEGLNVAGGFKYQELGNVLFDSLHGDYFNVVGLPTKKTYELLSQISKTE